MNPDEKLCPYCAEIIKAAAIRCKHCHADLAVAAHDSYVLSLPQDQLGSTEISDLLRGLVEKSLVDFEETAERYRLLESVRQYTTERLGKSGEADQIRAKHQELFVALAEEAEPHLTGPEQAAWLARLETEHDNLRAALILSGESALRLAGSIWRFWVVRGFVSEGRVRCGGLLEQSSQRPASAALASTLHAAGNLAIVQCDYVEARRCYEEAASMRRELGDRSGEAGSLGNLATIAQIEGDYGSALRQFERSLAIHEELGNHNGVAISLTCLGTLSQDQGDFDTAREFITRAISLNREIGNRAAEANGLNNLGCVERDAGNAQAARHAFEQALIICREVEYGWEASLTLMNLGNCALDEGDLVITRSCLSESLRIMRSVGARRHIAACLEAWGRLEALKNRMSRSARLFGAAAGLWDAVGVPRLVKETQAAEQMIAGVRVVLGDKAFEEEFAAGRNMTPDQAIDYALADGCE